MAALLTAQQMASELGLRPGTVKRWARSGIIPSLRLSGKVVRFDSDAVQRVLRERANDMKGPRRCTAC